MDKSLHELQFYNVLKQRE